MLLLLVVLTYIGHMYTCLSTFYGYEQRPVHYINKYNKQIQYGLQMC